MFVVELNVYFANRRVLSICRFSSNRKTLLDNVKQSLQCENPRVVVMAGAGISTPSGLPDFRYVYINTNSNINFIAEIARV